MNVMENDRITDIIIQRMDKFEEKLDCVRDDVVELKTKVGIFRQWMTGLAAFIGAAFSALVDYLGKHS